jgi:hypothetical protein
METNMPGYDVVKLYCVMLNVVVVCCSGPDHGEDFSVEERFRTFDNLGYKVDNNTTRNAQHKTQNTQHTTHALPLIHSTDITVQCVDYNFSQPPLEDHKEPSDSLYLTVCVHPPHKLIRAPNEKCGWRMAMPLLHEWMIE